MKFFSSLWFKIRKSNGLPPNQVFIPMTEKTEEKLQETPSKPKRTRKTKTKVANSAED